jgi:hypothetical protein
VRPSEEAMTIKSVSAILAFGSIAVVGSAETLGLPDALGTGAFALMFPAINWLSPQETRT